jgi:hypothetical protein
MKIANTQACSWTSIVHRSACLCGCASSDVSAPLRALQPRQHAYWDCPVAQAVARQLTSGLSRASLPCTQRQVWLVQAPLGTQQVVWDVVAMAALSAMDVGRRAMWFRHFDSALAPPLCVQAGCASAVSAFWLSLHNFARTCRFLPLKHWDRVGDDHPFLSVSGQPPRLLLRLPLSGAGSLVDGSGGACPPVAGRDSTG